MLLSLRGRTRTRPVKTAFAFKEPGLFNVLDYEGSPSI
jgi:hypothetical protein